jgi:endoglucanase
MRQDFVQICGDHFSVNGQKIRLRGYTLGSWMNLEHFMMGLPGTHSMIREAFSQVYGPKNAHCFFDALIKSMVSEGDIALLKQMGTNTVRIPLNYHYFIDDQDPSHFLEYGFEMLERVMAFCRKHELYAIVDLHAAPGAQNNDWHSDSITGQSLLWRYRCFQDQVCALWRELAKRYADDPWIAGYDVLNEPGYGLTREAFNGLYARIIAAIREADRDHIIFLEGDDFGRSFDLFDEPADPQVTYAVHFYPFVLDEDVLDPAMPDEKRTQIYETIFNRQLKVREKFHRPIWCGESGYNIPAGREAFTAGLLMKNISLCEDNDLSWSLWTYKDAGRMGIAMPRADSPWMRLRRRIERQWTHEYEQAASMKITRFIGEKYYQPLDEQLAYDLDFRVRSILHRIAVEQVLKPALRAIPWEEMKQYPASFAFENCDFHTIIIDAVSERLQKANASGNR